MLMLKPICNKIHTTCEDGQKSWNFPKFHMLTHTFTGIWAKGVTANYNTKVNKHEHRWAWSVYRCRSKKGSREQVNIITSSISWPLISSIRLQSKINGLPYLI